MQHLLIAAAAAAISSGSQNLASLETLNGANLAATAFSSGGSPTTCTSGVQLLSNGTARDRNLTSPFAFADIATGEWYASEPSTGIGSGYEARLTVNSGSGPTSGTTSSWLALSSNRTWDLSISTASGSASGNWTLEIRRSTGGPVLASATFDISVQVTGV